MSPMVVFVSGAVVLVAITLALVLRPLLRRAATADLSRQQLNAAIYRDQFAELDRDRDAGILSQADYDQARAELQRRLLEDSQTGKDGQAAAPASRALPVALGLALPLGAVLLYLALGTPAALNPLAGGAGSPHGQQFSSAEIEKLVAGLAAKLEGEPENYQGWSMLARSYKSMGRFPEAVRAYERSGPLLEQSAELLVDYADTLAAVAGGFNGKVVSLIDKALRIDPANAQGLWLRGTVAFEGGDYARAVADWDVLLGLLEPGSEDARVVQGNIDEARQKGGLKAGTGTRPRPGAATQGSPGSPAAGASIKGRVELAPAVAGKLPAGGVLMVVARPNDGSRMPVAVLRADAGRLPADFALDDSLAMSPDRKLSQFPEVLVEARISQSGQAVPQPGDLYGEAVVAKRGEQRLTLKIDRVR